MSCNLIAHAHEQAGERAAASFSLSRRSYQGSGASNPRFPGPPVAISAPRPPKQAEQPALGWLRIVCRSAPSLPFRHAQSCPAAVSRQSARLPPRALRRIGLHASGRTVQEFTYGANEGAYGNRLGKVVGGTRLADPGFLPFADVRCDCHDRRSA